MAVPPRAELGWCARRACDTIAPMLGIVLRLVCTALAVFLVTLLPWPASASLRHSTWQKVLTALLMAIILGVVNALLKPLIKLVGCALYVLTLGLISLVVNGLLFWLSGVIVRAASTCRSTLTFWPGAILGALLVTIVSVILGWSSRTTASDAGPSRGRIRDRHRGRAARRGAVHQWLSTDAYWASAVRPTRSPTSIANSLCFGVYAPDGDPGRLRPGGDRRGDIRLAVRRLHRTARRGAAGWAPGWPRRVRDHLLAAACPGSCWPRRTPTACTQGGFPPLPTRALDGDRPTAMADLARPDKEPTQPRIRTLVTGLTVAGEPDPTGYLFGVGAYLCWGLFPLYWKLLRAVRRPGDPGPPDRLVVPRRGRPGDLVRGWRRVAALVRRPRKAGSGRSRPRSLIAVNWGTYIYGVNADRVVETSLGYFINPW